MNKPIQVKPAMYTLFYEHLKAIALNYGYNLVLHGSLQRDMDLIAIPWDNNPRPEFEMIQDFECYLTGRRPGVDSHTMLPGGRNSYIINLNRGDKAGEWKRFDDCEYYLDISVTPFIKEVKP